MDASSKKEGHFIKYNYYEVHLFLFLYYWRHCHALKSKNDAAFLFLVLLQWNPCKHAEYISGISSCGMRVNPNVLMFFLNFFIFKLQDIT